MLSPTPSPSTTDSGLKILSFSSSLSLFSVSVMILVVHAEYLVLVVFTSEIGVDNVKGLRVRYRIFNSLQGGFITFPLYE